MSEEDDLCLLCDLGEGFEAGGGASIVEIDEEVVNDQRQWL